MGSCTQVLRPRCSDECHGGFRAHQECYCLGSIFKINELYNTVNQIHALSFVKRYRKRRLSLYTKSLCASTHLYVPSVIHHQANPGSRGKNPTSTQFFGTYQSLEAIQLHRGRRTVSWGKDIWLHCCFGWYFQLLPSDDLPSGQRLWARDHERSLSWQFLLPSSDLFNKACGLQPSLWIDLHQISII